MDGDSHSSLKGFLSRTLFDTTPKDGLLSSALLRSLNEFLTKLEELDELLGACLACIRLEADL